MNTKTEISDLHLADILSVLNSIDHFCDSDSCATNAFVLLQVERLWHSVMHDENMIDVRFRPIHDRLNELMGPARFDREMLRIEREHDAQLSKRIDETHKRAKSALNRARRLRLVN